MNSQATKSESSADGRLARLVGELMARYDAYRAMWVEEFGNADNFDAWFTSKAIGENQ